LAGKRVLVTGASQGIGYAIAELAAKRGAVVLAVARSVDLLQELAARVATTGQAFHVLQADITSPLDRQRMLDEAQKQMGGLDILVNNAGIGATGHFADTTPEVLRSIMETNFFGTTETTRLFLPMLKAGDSPAIVNISSIVGKRALPARGLYSASKFALQGWSEALRGELAREGVDVLIVNPGLTQTNFSKNMLEQKAKVQMDHLRGMTSEAVAEATLRATEKGRNETSLTGRGKMLLFFARFFPGVIDFFAKKKVRELFADEMAVRQKERQASV